MLNICQNKATPMPSTKKPIKTVCLLRVAFVRFNSIHMTSNFLQKKTTESLSDC